MHQVTGYKLCEFGKLYHIENPNILNILNKVKHTKIWCSFNLLKNRVVVEQIYDSLQIKHKNEVHIFLLFVLMF